MEESIMSAYHRISENGIEETLIEQVKYDQEYDVVIVGAGTAGSIVSVKLAQLGYKLCIIEKKNFMGGIYSSTMFQYYRGSNGGMYEKIDQIIREEKDKFQIADAFGSQPTIRRYVFDNLLKDTHTKIAYNSVLTGVYTSNQRIEGVQYYGDGKLTTIKAKVFIDASAEASLCRMAGLNAHKGRAFDGLCQPFSNVRIYYNFINQRVEFNNIDAGTMRQDNPCDYAQSVVKSLNNAVYSNPQKDEFTLGMSPIIGLREGYVIDGIKHLTMQEIVEGYTSHEPLYYSSANFDNHTKEMAFESEQLCDWVVGLSMWSTLVSVPVEKDMMRPKGLDNVLAIGRIMSMDHDVASHTRMMRDCQKAGEAAAILIDASLKNNIRLDDVKYADIEERLEKDNCLNITNNYGLKDNPPLDISDEMRIPKDDLELIKFMKSDRPGFAMLVAYREKKIELLSVCLNNSDTNLRSNSAIVLALLNQTEGHSILVELALKRDTYLPKTSKSYNMYRGLSAVYCLGRLHQKESYPILYNILLSNDRFVEDDFQFDKFIGSKEDYRFQYVAHCIRALINISNHNPELKEEIMKTLNNVINQENFKVYTSLKSNQNDLHDMTTKLREYIQYRMK